MKFTKGQFISLWIIFGIICIYAIKQLIFLLDELSVTIGINIDLMPDYLKFARVAVLSILLLIVIIVSIFIYRQKSKTQYFPRFKPFRFVMFLVLLFGVVFKILNIFLSDYRFRIFNEYIERHEVERFELYSGLFIYPNLFYLIILVYLLVFGFMLINKIEKKDLLIK